MLRLFTDTDTDITPALAEEYGFTLISMPYAVEGKTVYPYEDFEVFDDHAFYDQLRNGVLPNTSALSREQYLLYFEPVFAAGDDIFYIHFSRGMTATFDVMDQAVEMLRKRYPERRFYDVDTKGATTLSYAIVRAVGEQFRAGRSHREIMEWVASEVDHYAMYLFADDLKFFRHSGRVTGLAGTMGSLLGIRPIICMNQEGKLVFVGKEKGRQKAIERLVAYVEELGDNVARYPVYIGHTDAPEIAQELADALQQRFDGRLKLELVPVNPTSGSHCGPNGVGVCFHAKHR